MSDLILPGDYCYEQTLANIPSFWNRKRDLLPSEGGAIIYDSDTGLPRIASWAETQEYLHDGEYDLRMNEIDAGGEEDPGEPTDLFEGAFEVTDADLKANWEFLKAQGRL